MQPALAGRLHLAEPAVATRHQIGEFTIEQGEKIQQADGRLLQRQRQGPL